MFVQQQHPNQDVSPTTKLICAFKYKNYRASMRPNPYQPNYSLAVIISLEFLAFGEMG
jgi:hypothetical protein